jgi:metallo-beta-lactamase class B
MGGLISMYAAMRYPYTYGKAGIFSPAFWFAESAMHTWMNGLILPSNLRVYFVAGTTESSSMMPDINQMRNLLAAAGVADSNLRVVPESDGAHSEWFWNREFPDAYTWLWDDVSTSIPVEASKPTVKLYPNPVESTISICRETSEIAIFQIRSLIGQVLNNGILLQTCDQISLLDFKSGVYLMEVIEKDGSVTFNRFVVK